MNISDSNPKTRGLPLDVASDLRHLLRVNEAFTAGSGSYPLHSRHAVSLFVQSSILYLVSDIRLMCF